MRATVVIPCYRPDANFEKTLADLNAQTSEEFCVILADDGNQPPLAPRVAKTLTRPHEIVRFDTNRGIVAGLNACIVAASTPFIVRMDADDRMPPDRIERQLAFMDAHPDVDVAGAAMAVFGSGIRVWAKPADHASIQASLLWGPALNHPTVVAKTTVMLAHPYPEGFPLAEDYALWLHMASAGVRMANDSQVAVHYRMEGQNTSQNGAERRAARYTDMFKHALSILLGDASARTMSSGVDTGCHHVLAGMPPPPECHPTFQDLESHAHTLRDALAQVHEPWADQAAQDLQVRLARAQGKGRWHKLDAVWALGRLRASDWRQLLSSDR